MDGFGGYKTAATEALPEAVTVMDPFHVVALAGHELDLCRQRVQQDTLGHRGRRGTRSPGRLGGTAQLGRTLHRRRDDVLACFTPRASNGPIEAVNGRLEALRRNALGFRNLINYCIRSLLHCGGLAL